MVGDRTRIEWADSTWNPMTGCSEVSPGCENCYARTTAERFRGVKGHYFERGFDLQLRPEQLLLPLRWRRPRRIFVNSMSDVFHARVPDEYIARVWAVMSLAQGHEFIVLTKRHGRMRSLLSSPGFRDLLDETVDEVAGQARVAGSMSRARLEQLQRQWWRTPYPLQNVLVGVSVEDQARADLRLPALAATPAAARVVSCEPLLGPVVLCRCDGASFEVRRHPFLVADDCPLHGQARIDWLIVGGESGPAARPMHPDWLRGLRDQCTTAGVPFLFKQWGRWRHAEEFTLPPGEAVARHGSVDLYPEVSTYCVSADGVADNQRPPREGDAPMQRVGKRLAGRLLDGRKWNQFPRVGCAGEVVVDDGVGYCLSCGDRLERGQDVVRLRDGLVHADVCLADLTGVGGGHRD